MSRALLAGLALVGWGLAAGASLAAGQPEVAILEPAAGARLTRMPFTIRVDLVETALTGTVAATLNGSPIAANFVFDPPAGGRVAGEARFVWDPALVLLGANVLVVEVQTPGGPASGTVAFETAGDPYPEAVVSASIGAGGGFRAGELPGVVLGPPVGSPMLDMQGLDVVALGLGPVGSITVEFTDNVIVDGDGVDFLVFENPFLITSQGVTLAPFMEPGIVSVSQDGSHWVEFPCALAEPMNYFPGCAGVYPVLSAGEVPHPSIPTTVPIEDLLLQPIGPELTPPGAGGDGFDLADMGLAWARFVRIESSPTANPDAGAPGIGFDLDAVAAIHSAPEAPPGVPALPGLARLALGGLLCAAGWWARRRHSSARSWKRTGTATIP